MKTLLTVLSSLTLTSTPALTTVINNNQTALPEANVLRLKGAAISYNLNGWSSWIQESEVWTRPLGNMDQKFVTMTDLDFYSLFHASLLGNLQEKINKDNWSFKVDSNKTDWQTIEYASDKTEPNGYGFESHGRILWRVVNNGLEIKIKLELWAGSWWLLPTNTSTTSGHFNWEGNLVVN